MEGECALAMTPCPCECDAAAIASQLRPRSLEAQALLLLALALVLVLDVVGVVAVYRTVKKARHDSNRARREARRLESKQRGAKPTPSSQLFVDKRLRAEYYMDPDKNAEWKVVRDEDLSHVPIPEGWDDGLQALQDRIGVHFKDKRHLKCAMVHHSVLSRKEPQIPGDVPVYRVSNRCLEFLGDSVLAMAVASYVFQAQPMHQEGKLTRAKDMLVNNQTLSKVCVEDLEMDELVIVDRTLSMKVKKGNMNPAHRKSRITIAAGVVESLIGAIYLDQGLECVLDFINRHVLPHAIRHAASEVFWDPALALQTLLQAHGMGHPTFENIPTATRTGEEDRDVALIVQGQRILTATGSSYKTARRQVANDGYQHYVKLLGPLPPT